MEKKNTESTVKKIGERSQIHLEGHKFVTRTSQQIKLCIAPKWPFILMTRILFLPERSPCVSYNARAAVHAKQTGSTPVVGGTHGQAAELPLVPYWSIGNTPTNLSPDGCIAVYSSSLTLEFNHCNWSIIDGSLIYQLEFRTGLLRKSRRLLKMPTTERLTDILIRGH